MAFKPVISINNATNEVQEFSSSKDAAEFLGLSCSGIRSCLSGARITNKGYRFAYGTLKDYNDNPDIFPSKFETKTISQEKRAVIIFNPDTSVKAFCSSSNEAAKILNATPSSVRDCIKGKTNTVKGHVLTYGTQKDYLDGKVRYKVPERHGKNFPIVQLDDKRNYIRTFQSNDEIEEFSRRTWERHPIMRCANHKVETAYGFIWEFLDEWILKQK